VAEVRSFITLKREACAFDLLDMNWLLVMLPKTIDCRNVNPSWLASKTFIHSTNKYLVPAIYQGVLRCWITVMNKTGRDPKT
jgi:hypothetical protein